MVKIMDGPTLNIRLSEDPRLSVSQRQAMVEIGRADPNAKVLGLDGRMRPVIEGKMPGPRSKATFALLRNGEPTAVSRASRGKFLSEVWE